MTTWWLGWLGCALLTNRSPDRDGDGWGADVDCDDASAAVHPGATEVWYDGVDQDCSSGSDHDQDRDGASVDVDCDDEDPARAAPVGGFVDRDGDGWGAAPLTACPGTPGWTAEPGDCDDATAAVHPTADEGCDGVDDDCDGAVDDADPSLDPIERLAWHPDLDGDTFGGAETWSGCRGPAGWVVTGGDCDDARADRSPAAPEVCDGVDDDCDGAVDAADDSLEPAWFADLDADGFGDPATRDLGCEPRGAAWVHDGTDCDDRDPAVNPAAQEVCNHLDDDCDVSYDAADPTVEPTRWYADADGDGFGDPSAPTATQCAGSPGWAADATDCDDADPDRFPGAPEVWDDGVDQDCAGGSDFDQDGDGVVDADDCAPTDPAAYPGAPEVYYDGVDQDCAGGSDFDQDGDGVPVDLDCADADPAVQLPRTLDVPTPDLPLTTLAAVPGCTDLALALGAGTYPWGDAPLAVALTVTGVGPATVLDFSGLPTEVSTALGLGDLAVVAPGPITLAGGALALDRVTVTGAAPEAWIAGEGAVTLADTTLDRVDPTFALAGSVVAVEVAWVGVARVGEVAGPVTLDRWTFDASGGLTADTLVATDGSAVGAPTPPLTAGVATVRGFTALDTAGTALIVEAEATLDDVTVVGADTALALSGVVDARRIAIADVAVGWSVDADWAAVGVTVARAGAAVVDRGSSPRYGALQSVIFTEVDAPWVGPAPLVIDGVVDDPAIAGARLAAGPPAFVAWATPIAPGLVDLHLRAGSPGIDAGDPLALDPDGTRADAGFAGGPGAAPWYADADADALPDGWEAGFDLDLDPAADLDGDGWDAAREYAAGTWPTAADTDGDGSDDAVDADPLGG